MFWFITLTITLYVMVHSGVWICNYINCCQCMFRIFFLLICQLNNRFDLLLFSIWNLLLIEFISTFHGLFFACVSLLFKQFLYMQGNYKVYNLCSERLYDASLFQGKVCFPCIYYLYVLLISRRSLKYCFIIVMICFIFYFMKTLKRKKFYLVPYPILYLMMNNILLFHCKSI